jgi:hypothetical protein
MGIVIFFFGSFYGVWVGSNCFSDSNRSIEAIIVHSSLDLITPPIRAKSNNAVGSLFVHRLRNCMVYAGPMICSILIDEAEGCVFVMALHQIRIHNVSVSQCLFV